jgi:hypothetical protein
MMLVGGQSLTLSDYVGQALILFFRLLPDCSPSRREGRATTLRSDHRSAKAKGRLLHYRRVLRRWRLTMSAIPKNLPAMPQTCCGPDRASWLSLLSFRRTPRSVCPGQPAAPKPEAIGVGTTMVVAFACSAGPLPGAWGRWRLAPQNRQREPPHHHRAPTQTTPEEDAILLGTTQLLLALKAIG